MGKRRLAWIRRHSLILLIPHNFYNSAHWPLRCITNLGRMVMLRQIYFLHYRLITEAIFAGLTISAAAVMGYLILLLRV